MEVEYPDNEDEYVAFLDTEIKIDSNGILSTRYYRKSQNKDITLNYNSHHQLSTKHAVANNYYKTASEVSSGADELQHSESIVDSVLQQNGYLRPLVRSKLLNTSVVNQPGRKVKRHH